MSDYSELKRVAEELIAANDLFFNESPQCNEVGDAWSLADDRFTEAASPEVILALIAENERLKNRLEVDPRHSYDGIATRDATIKALDEQADQLKAECEGLRLDASLHTQLQRAAEVLPGAWSIEVVVEHHAGWIDVFDDGGNKVMFDGEGHLGEQVSDAIDLALTLSKESGQ